VTGGISRLDIKLAVGRGGAINCRQLDPRLIEDVGGGKTVEADVD
jgi:hypothetical protein